MAGEILFGSADGVGRVTISNPARHNALTTRMMAELGEALQKLDSAPEVRVIVVRGAGTTAFAAGADISEFESQQTSAQARRESDQAVATLFDTLAGLVTPLIAAVQGHCLGAGLAVALGADVRIAAEGSRFAIPAARLGIGYPVTLTHALVDIVGPAHAADILYSGRTLTDGEALAAGLVNRIVPGPGLVAAVDEFVGRIVVNAPLSVAAAKAAIRARSRPGHLARAQELVAACVDSSDVREGQRAFREKRSPVFRGV